MKTRRSFPPTDPLTWIAILACLLTVSAFPAPARADDDFNARQEQLLREVEWPGSMRICIGITRLGTRLWCVMDKDALDYHDPAARILAVAGLAGSETDWEAVKATVQRGLQHRRERGARFRLAVVPLANPDGYFLKSGTKNGSGGDPSHGYPPEGTAYNSPTDPERMHIWRFAGWFAPDLLVELQAPTAPDWKAALSSSRFENAWAADSLAAAANREAPAEVGTIPSIRYVVGLGEPSSAEEKRDRLRYSGFERLAANPFGDQGELPPSPARIEAQHRLGRTPLEVLSSLAKHYGDHLDHVSYQPALAVICRSRLGDLTGDASHRRSVAALLEPYLAAQASSIAEKTNGSQLAGHLVFADWAVRTGDQRAVALVRKAADFAFDESGRPREAMPFHHEMSDAVFMACPILCAAGRLTGDRKYFDMARRHLDFMQQLCRRDDDIYRNSPLCDAAWGRGNGFPALGLALATAHVEDYLAEAAPSAADKRDLAQLAGRFRNDLRAHLQALRKHQDVTGMWYQVVDEPGSYRELTSTCMIGYSIVEGMRRGWLDEAEFAPVVRRAWDGVSLRIGREGSLLDVCTGTGKQKSLRDYLDRTAILGPDERGGAMAMLFAAQMAAWNRAAGR